MTDDRFARLSPKAVDPLAIRERVVWALEGHGRTAEARSGIVPLGPALRVYVDSELLWSQVIRRGALDQWSAETLAHWEAKRS
jgi:hypothetical protein